MKRCGSGIDSPAILAGRWWLAAELGDMYPLHTARTSQRWRPTNNVILSEAKDLA